MVHDFRKLSLRSRPLSRRLSRPCRLRFI